MPTLTEGPPVPPVPGKALIPGRARLRAPYKAPRAGFQATSCTAFPSPVFCPATFCHFRPFRYPLSPPPRGCALLGVPLPVLRSEACPRKQAVMAVASCLSLSSSLMMLCYLEKPDSLSLFSFPFFFLVQCFVIAGGRVNSVPSTPAWPEA